MLGFITVATGAGWENHCYFDCEFDTSQEVTDSTIAKRNCFLEIMQTTFDVGAATASKFDVRCQHHASVGGEKLAIYSNRSANRAWLAQHSVNLGAVLEFPAANGCYSCANMWVSCDNHGPTDISSFQVYNDGFAKELKVE